MKRAAALTAAPLLIVALIALDAVAPSSRTASAPDSCPYSGGGPPYTFQSWEGERDRIRYLNAQLLAAHNHLFPTDEEFALPPLLIGGDGERLEDRGAVIPAPLLYAIGWVESSTNQTALDVPYGSIGSALVSFDCGYGIMQVASTILNEGALPNRYEALVGTHFAYNIAAGAQILAEKWNDDFYPVLGGADPALIESWYYALWAYNGWADSNHPAGPDVDPFRAPSYGCDGRRNGYPYQELVFGCLANPPEVDGRRLWLPVPVSLPDLGVQAASGGPLDPVHFYEGWNRLRMLDFAVEQTSAAPFREMNLPLPRGSGDYVEPSLNTSRAQRLRGEVLGNPSLKIDDSEIELSTFAVEESSAALLITNGGSGLLPWRVAAAPSWLQLDVSAGVAVGAEHTFERPIGKPSQLLLHADASGVPEGEHIAELRLEFSLPDGSINEHAVTVSLNKLGAAFYHAGYPQS